MASVLGYILARSAGSATLSWEHLYSVTVSCGLRQLMFLQKQRIEQKFFFCTGGLS